MKLKMQGKPEKHDLPRYLSTATASSPSYQAKGDVANFGHGFFVADLAPRAAADSKEMDSHGFQHFSRRSPSGPRTLRSKMSRRLLPACGGARPRAPDFFTGLCRRGKQGLDRIGESHGSGPEAMKVLVTGHAGQPWAATLLRALLPASHVCACSLAVTSDRGVCRISPSMLRGRVSSPRAARRREGSRRGVSRRRRFLVLGSERR